MSKPKTTVYYVASTHWDREWYEPFQHFRYHLVEMLDEVIETLQRDPRYACFQTDGQSILLEDYLEVRPEQAECVRALARDGRLRLGPWYTMPDEFLVTGESLVRNLEEGLRVAREFGNASKAGFVCDMFGHTSQMPQIFQQFGIESAYVFRGTTEAEQRGVFRWQAPDGSEVVTFHFGPKDGYFDYGAWMRLAFWPEKPFIISENIEKIAEYIDMQRGRVELDSVLLFDGGDHMPIEPKAADLLEGIAKARPEFEVKHAGLDEYGAALVARRDQIPRISTGELRAPGGPPDDGRWLIPGVSSSRIRLKQANRHCETALCHWVEPFCHLASELTGWAYPGGFIRRAWRHLLENHAHDSICGCSPDQVHKDMEFRFDQARLIASKLTDKALHAIACQVKSDDLSGEEFDLVVFNPTQQDIDGPVDLDLYFDANTKNLFGEWFKFEWKVGFRMFDADGAEVPYDYLGYIPSRNRFYRKWAKVAVGEQCLIASVTAPLKIPAFGYTTLRVKPMEAITRHPPAHVVSGDRTLENDKLRVDVADNGTLRLTDKRSGQTYDRLLYFEDRADIGDGWFHGMAVNDRVISSTASPAEVEIVDDGAFKGTLCITNRLQVPVEFAFKPDMRRSAERAELKIENYVTLRAGGDDLEIRTVVHNNVRDHRVRVLFESGAKAKTYLSDMPFDVVERNIAPPPENYKDRELVVETTPHSNWTAVCDDQRGLAVVAPGIPETAVRDVPERPLALTLFRGFRRTVHTDGEEGGQEIGQLEFNYRLVPLTGAPDRADLTARAQLVSGGVQAAQVLRRDQLPADQRKLPRTLSQLKLTSGQTAVTSLRRQPRGEGLEVRLFNPTDAEVAETLKLHDGAKNAKLTDFEGNEQETLKVGGQGEVSLKLPPKRIATIVIEQ